MKQNVQKKHRIKTSNHVSEHVAPGTQIHYESDLIEKLEKEHVRLLNLLKKVQGAHNQKKSKKTIKKLKKFNTIFIKHMIVENIKLYIYLKHSFNNNPEKKNQVMVFRKEMRKISKYVLAFDYKYKDRIVSNKQALEFKKDLKSVYLTLKKRFKREEKELFPLYQDKF